MWISKSIDNKWILKSEFQKVKFVKLTLWCEFIKETFEKWVSKIEFPKINYVKWISKSEFKLMVNFKKWVKCKIWKMNF